MLALLVTPHRGMDDFPVERFGITDRLLALASVLPCGDVAELFVVALGLAVVVLVFLADMPAARSLDGERTQGQQFAEYHEVGHPARAFQRLVQVMVATGHIYILPEFLA